MSFWGFFCLVVLLSVWLPACPADIPQEVHRMECHDGYLMIAVDLNFTGKQPRFEAVDGTGVYPITLQYAAQCGYTISVIPLPALVELRASYFSCHTDNKDDKVFTFNINLITTQSGEEVHYTLNKMCSLPLTWSPREISCEVNYMEVSVMIDAPCPSAPERDDSAVKPVKASSTSDWQVVFHKAGEQLRPMNLSDARKHGYVFNLTDRRLVFRALYGQCYSISEEVSGVPVEVVHATLFSTQSWLVLMVDLVAACSMDEGSFVSGSIVWKTPQALHALVSGVNGSQISFGLNGELLERRTAEERGYSVDKLNATLEISIPYNTEGGYRKSLVSGDLHELYIFNLYSEQTMLDEDDTQTRVRSHRTLVSPLLLRPVSADDQTSPEDQFFTIYLGDVPEDVKLTAVQLNGHMYIVPFITSSGHTITEVVHDNHTHDYTVQVPFDHHVVTEQFSREDEAIKHMLDINFTLTVLPENEHFYHHTSVYALTDASPPEFEANCSETGIIFKMDHRPFDYLWFISIGSERLTPELAAEHKYDMRNDSQSLVLEVPLFTAGYQYKDFSLKGFLGTFEVLVRDHGTSDVQTQVTKSCPFSPKEFIACSTDGMMTVMVDLSWVVALGGIPARTNLADKYCGPKEADDTRALFSFPLNSCGSIIKLGKEYVTYENVVFSTKTQALKYPSDSSNIQGVKLQCTYALAGLHRLFSVYKFDSDTEGVGQIVHPAQSPEVQQEPIGFNEVLQTPGPAVRHTRPFVKQPPSQHIRVSSLVKNLPKGTRGATQLQVRYNGL